MTYPPSTLPVNAIDGPSATDVSDPAWVLTAAEVNATNVAINDIVTELGTDPSGAEATVTARLSALDSTVAAKADASATTAALAAKAALAGATYTGAHDFTGATVTGISGGGGARAAQSGRWALPVGLRGSAFGLGSWWLNRMYLVPFTWDVDATKTVTEIGLYVSTAGAADAVVRAGVYQIGASGEPGSLLRESGPMSGATTGFKSAAVTPFQMPTGLYALAVVWQQPSGSSPLLQVSNAYSFGVQDALSLSVAEASGGSQAYAWQATGVSGALPASVTSPSRANETGGWIALKIQ